MRADPKRTQRVEERIRNEISELLVLGRIKDPRVGSLMVSNVIVTNDLQHARVFVRAFAQPLSGTDKELAVKIMNGAAAFVRKEIGSKLQLRFAPEIRFFWDDRAEEAERVQRLLEDLKSEPPA